MASLLEEDQEPLKPATGVLTSEDSPASILEQESPEGGTPKGSLALEQVEVVQPPSPRNVVGSEEPPSSEDLPVPLANCLARMSEEVALLRQDMAKRIEDLEQELERREKYIEDNMELATQVSKTRFDQLQQEMQTQKDAMITNRQLAEQAHEQVNLRATRKDLAQTQQQLLMAEVLVTAAFVVVIAAAFSSYIMSPSCDCHLRMAEIETYTAVVPATVNTVPNSENIMISEPFYTHVHGYKVRLVLKTGQQQNTKVISVQLRLMRGEFDDSLGWPFHGNFTIQVLDKNARVSNTILHHFPLTEGARVTIGDMAQRGSLFQVLFEYKDLKDYLNGGVLQCKVTHFEPNQTSVFWKEISNINTEQKRLWEELHYMVIPASIRMSEFRRNKKIGKDWHSQPFYAFQQGYKVRLVVRFESYGISVGIQLIGGRFDNGLDWPFHGNFTIKLLGSIRTKTRILVYPDILGQRVSLGKVVQEVAWLPQFCEYEQLSEVFLQDDSIHFSIAQFSGKENVILLQLDAVRANQKAMWSILTYYLPLNITIRNFSDHCRFQSTWYSDPFYTEFRGYKMQLRVAFRDAAGYEYVSVYVHMMRGEYDDRLHWPFQGKIKFELLNRQGEWVEVRALEHVDGWFYSAEDKLRRETTKDRATEGWGFQNFITCSEVRSTYLRELGDLNWITIRISLA